MDEPNQAAPRQRATIKTIANLTGLSPSTVSLSLRGGARISDETRRKVAAAAEAVGYVPDRAGVRLRTGKTQVITLVLDGAEDSVDFARHLIHGIGQAISGTSYNLNVVPAFDRSKSLQVVRTIVDQRTADGVILTHTSAQDSRVDLLIKACFPFVTHGRTEFSGQHAFHDFHSERFVALAAERLAQRGRQNILLIIGDDTTYTYRKIADTFRETIARLGIKGRILEGRAATGRSAEMRQLGEDLSRDAARPDGIICNSEMRAAAIVGGLLDGGMVLGRDIEVVYKQTSDLLPVLLPRLDSVIEDVSEAGGELTRLLLRLINGETVQKLQTLGKPEPRWRAGQ